MWGEGSVFGGPPVLVKFLSGGAKSVAISTTLWEGRGVKPEHPNSTGVMATRSSGKGITVNVWEGGYQKKNGSLKKRGFGGCGGTRDIICRKNGQGEGSLDKEGPMSINADSQEN